MIRTVYLRDVHSFQTNEMKYSIDYKNLPIYSLEKTLRNLSKLTDPKPVVGSQPGAAENPCEQQTPPTVSGIGYMSIIIRCNMINKQRNERNLPAQLMLPVVTSLVKSLFSL